MYTVGEVMGRSGVVLCNQSIGIPYKEVRVERRRRGDFGTGLEAVGSYSHPVEKK
jgi:hypothetical protein